MVADAAGQGVFPQPFVGKFGVVATNSLVVGRCKKGCRRIADHHVRVIAAARSAGNQTAIAIHVYHRVAKTVHDFGISKRPQKIQRPLAAPQRVEIIVWENRLARRIGFHSPHHSFFAGVVGITAIRITDDMAAEQSVPEIRVKLHALRLRAALHADAPEPVVPIALGIADDSIKIPARQFRFQILAGVFFARVGNGHLHQNLLARPRGKLREPTRVFSRDAVLRSRQKLAILPRPELHGLAEPCHKINGKRLGPPAGRGHHGMPGELSRADLADSARNHFGHERRPGVERDDGFFIRRKGIAVKPDARRGGQFRRDGVALQK